MFEPLCPRQPIEHNEEQCQRADLKLANLVLPYLQTEWELSVIVELAGRLTSSRGPNSISPQANSKPAKYHWAEHQNSSQFSVVHTVKTTVSRSRLLDFGVPFRFTLRSNSRYFARACARPNG